MFFTKAATIVAWLATVLGFLVVLTGCEISFQATESMFADIMRIHTEQRAVLQAGTFINQGAAVLLCGLVLGVLTEISRSVCRSRE